MPIGKSSIQKRVAKVDPEKKNEAPELVATTGVAPKKEAPKKTSAAKTATTTKSTAAKPAAKKIAAKKSTATKAEKVTPPAEAKVNTAVVANIAPETVEKVTGHKEKDNFEKISLGGKLPAHLL